MGGSQPVINVGVGYRGEGSSSGFRSGRGYARVRESLLLPCSRGGGRWRISGWPFTGPSLLLTSRGSGICAAPIAHQVAVRAGLYRAMREAFGRAGISWDDCGHEDRGDGVFVLVPAEVPKGLLVESLPSALVTALRAHNAAHPGPERIRLRMALHAGEVSYDEHGVTAASVNLAFRLLEAGALKAALAGSRACWRSSPRRGSSRR